jgi:uncharacterized RDD family membrane protein YckC
MYCSKCGTVIAEDASFCSACGQRTRVTPPPTAGAVATQAPAAAYRPPYAGFWLRFVAYWIDAVIIGIPLAFIFAALFASAGLWATFHGLQEGVNPVAFAMMFIGMFLRFILIAVIGKWLYYASMESSSWQATLGKKALDLRVTDLAGQRVTFARASGRFFARIISSLIPFFIGYIVAGFTEKKQAVHDMIARCLVMRRA